MRDERLGQNYCIHCKKPIGFTEQGAAWASYKYTGFVCPKHHDEEEKLLEKEADEANGIYPISKLK